VAVARQVGMSVLGLTLLTKRSLIEFDTDEVVASHEETLDSGRRRAEDIKLFIARIVERISVQE